MQVVSINFFMKILFDYKIFYQQKFGGISNYFYNLGSELLNFPENVKFISPIHKNNYLKDLNKKNIKGLFFNFLPSSGIRIYENINHYLSNKYIQGFKPDIIHETYYSKKKYKSKI